MSERQAGVSPLPPRAADRPIGTLLSDLARQSGLLVRQEVALAKAEVLGKFGQLGSGAGFLAAGGMLCFAGLLYLMAAAVLGLAIVLAPWLAALIVGVVALVIGGAVAWLGKSRMQSDNLVPRRTIRSLKDDAEWAREQIR